MFLCYFFPLLILLSTLTTAQVIPTQPIFDCTNTNFQVVYTACHAGDYSHCCGVGTDCCAGGCCTLTSWCVGAGTSKEACCDINDATLCGTGPSLPIPSVVCEGGNGLSSYQCPHGSTCNTYNDTCYLPPDVASSSSAKASAVGTADSSSNAAPSTIVVTASSNADTPRVTPTSTGGSVSVSVVTVSTSPTVTAGKSSATSNFVSCAFTLLILNFILVVVWL